MLARKTEFIDIDAIQLGDRLRHVNAEAVASLRASIEKIGLRTPITVRMMDADAISDPMLVSGLHRLEACKALGHQQIECFVIEHESDDEARMWEIAENLHRAELDEIERARHIDEWRAISARVAQVGPPYGGTQPAERGIRKTAKELGVSRQEVERAAAIAQITPEAEAVAKDAGLQNNKGVLVAAVKSGDDVAFLRAEHERRQLIARKRSVDAVVNISAAEDFAHWIMDRTDLSEMPTIISWLEGTKAKEVIAAMRRIAA